MPQYYPELVADAPSGSKAVIQASRLLPWLISSARKRTLVTYLEATALLKYSDPRPLKHILAYPLFWCIEEKLPIITSIVVDQGTMFPGEGLFIDELDVHEEQAKVFLFDWFEVVPPTIAEMVAAREEHRQLWIEKRHPRQRGFDRDQPPGRRAARRKRALPKSWIIQ